MKPRYCKNCKYYCNTSYSLGTVNYNPRNPHQCSYKDNLEFVDNAIGTDVQIKKFANEINKNNDCMWYKKKWYKFGD